MHLAAPSNSKSYNVVISSTCQANSYAVRRFRGMGILPMIPDHGQNLP